MKKFMFSVLFCTAFAMTLGSCGNGKTDNVLGSNDSIDSVETVDTIVMDSVVVDSMVCPD